jgi:hypothetical protein
MIAARKKPLRAGNVEAAAMVKQAKQTRNRGYCKNESKPATGFLKMMRTPETEELVCDPLSFALLANIALRARWRESFSLKGLNRGEALVGDYRRLGLTRRQYRTHLKRLVEWGLITIRPTRRGTIAKLNLEPAKVFDIGISPEPVVGRSKNGQHFHL